MPNKKETFQHAVITDREMTPEQKAFWLSQESPEREMVGIWKCPACGNEQQDEYEHGDYTCDNCGKVVEWLFVDWI